MQSGWKQRAADIFQLHDLEREHYVREVLYVGLNPPHINLV